MLSHSVVSDSLKARILSWVSISSSRGSAWHRNWTHVLNPRLPCLLHFRQIVYLLSHQGSLSAWLCFLASSLLLLYPLRLGVRRGKIKGQEQSVMLRARTAGVRCERPLPGRCPHVGFSLYVASPETLLWEDHGCSPVTGASVSGWEIPAPGSYCPPPRTPTPATCAGLICPSWAAFSHDSPSSAAFHDICGKSSLPNGSTWSSFNSHKQL